MVAGMAAAVGMAAVGMAGKPSMSDADEGRGFV